MALAPLSASFWSLPPLLTSKVGPSGAVSCVGRFVYILGPCVSLQWTFLLRLEVSPTATSTPKGFSISGLSLYFPSLEPWGVWSVSLPLCSSWFIWAQMWSTGSASHRLAGSASCSLLTSCSLAHPAPQSTTSLGPPATVLTWVLSAQLRVSTPPTGLDECFFFNSLVVGLPYSSIFCQFWLFFVFKLLSFFWLCKKAQCVYLCLHLGR